MTMANRESRQVDTVVLRDCGQASTGPSAVPDQSNARMCSAIRLRPTKIPLALIGSTIPPSAGCIVIKCHQIRLTLEKTVSAKVRICDILNGHNPRVMQLTLGGLRAWERLSDKNPPWPRANHPGSSFWCRAYGRHRNTSG